MMVVCVDAYCVDETRHINWGKALCLEVKAVDKDFCIIVVPEAGELVVDRQQVANAVTSVR
jgi:hypothetical protein